MACTNAATDANNKLHLAADGAGGETVTLAYGPYMN